MSRRDRADGDGRCRLDTDRRHRDRVFAGECQCDAAYARAWDEYRRGTSLVAVWGPNAVGEKGREGRRAGARRVFWSSERKGI
jgi:hypothetical protein